MSYGKHTHTHSQKLQQVLDLPTCHSPDMGIKMGDGYVILNLNSNEELVTETFGVTVSFMLPPVKGWAVWPKPQT